MANTESTTYVSELTVPTSVLMFASGCDPYSAFTTYEDIYNCAKTLNVGMSQNDHDWWRKRGGVKLSTQDHAVMQRSVLAGSHIFYDFYQGNCPYGAEIVGRNNENFPPDFRIGNDLFSLKDDSNILWNTTPKSLLPYIQPDVAEALNNGDLAFLQGRPTYDTSGKIKTKQPAYDWFLYADHDLCQYNYQNLLWSVFQLFYDIKMWKQPEWNPHCGEGEWWYFDESYGGALAKTPDLSITGSTSIPDGERIVFQNDFGGHYSVCLYDGFDENGYPTTFLGLRNTDTPSIGIIPIVFYDEEMYPSPYFDGSAGMGQILIGDVLNRSDYAVNEEYIPFYNFGVNKAGNQTSLPQGIVKALSRFITRSPYSPSNVMKEVPSFYEPNVPSSVKIPIGEIDTYDMGIPLDTLMTPIEYWMTRLKLAASDALAFCVDDIVSVNETELLSLLARIYDTPYYYVRMFDDGPVMYRVPARYEIGQLNIASIDFDSNQKNTMMVVSCGSDEAPVCLRIEFRNKGGLFAGAPDMVVLYDESSDLNGIYERIL